MEYKFVKCENSDTIIYLFDNELKTEANCNLVLIKVSDWLNDLSLWKTEKYEGNADKTLREVVDIIETVEAGLNIKKRYIGGYSLAGLFSLYGYLKTDLFDGAMSVSGSLWYPGFVDFVKKTTIRDGKIYLSLGDSEEFTKFKDMKSVGDNTRFLAAYFKERVSKCIYVVNKGGHFDEPDKRVLKGIKWLLEDYSYERK